MQFIFLFLKDLVPLFDWLPDNNCAFALVNTAKNYKLAQFQQYFHNILWTLKYIFLPSVAELTGNFLKREWFRPDGERESGAKYNEALQFLLR